MNQKEKIRFTHRLPPCTGRNIRKFRQEKNLTGDQLAEVVGISPSFISCLERGKRTGANYPILRDIAAALGRSVEELMGEENASILSPEEQRFRLLQLVEKIIVSEDLSHDETVRQMEIILKISENLLNKVS